MSLADIVILAVLAATVFLIVADRVKKHKRGEAT